MNISESLVEIQNLLGESYYKIGDSLKQLKDEVDSSLSESETVIEDFKNNLKNASEGSLSSVVVLLEEKLKEAQKGHKEYTDQFLSVMSRIFDSFKVLDNMHLPISCIIESAEQMELHALNAMVVAIQAGNQGGGFTCITDGFQKNAKTTFHLAGNLNNQREVVSGQFDRLQDESKEVLELQKKISSGIKGSLTNDFSALKNSIRSAVDFIEDVYNEAQQMKPAVHTVFEGLQNQDIIRQSMDHMLLSLNELEKLKTGRNPDEEIFLSKQLNDLCIFVIDEIIEQLGTDEKNLKDNIGKMINLLTELDERKNRFSIEQFNTETNGLNLVKCLHNISATFKDVVSKSENICSFENEIIKHKNRLLKSFSQLHNSIVAFQAPVSLFNNTIVLARIEIARQSVIRNVETSINDIDTEVRIISDSAKEIENIYENFHVLNRAIDFELKRLIDENNVFTENFKSDIKKQTYLSEQSGKMFRELLNELNFLSSSFKTIFTDMESNIALIGESKKSLEKIKADIAQDLAVINQSYNMIDNERLAVLMNNNEIDSLLNKFTIFRHKGKILNEEISEQSVSESSITLF